MVSNDSALFPSNCSSSSLLVANVAISCLYFLVFPIALLLNGTALWVSLHLRSTSTFIVYLKNLVAADLLLTLTLPLTGASKLPGAAVELRVFDCRFSSVIFYCCMYTSISLMGLISLDRFFKIVRPGGMMLGQNVLFSLVMSILVWVLLFGATVIPTVILTENEPINSSEHFCLSLKSPAGLTLHSFVVVFMEVLFWLVTVLVVFCYICITVKVLQSFRQSGSNNSQGKKKTKLRVFLVLVVFFMCFVPLHILRIPFNMNVSSDSDDCTKMWLLIVYKFALWVSTTNACLDPLLYIYLCREFKDKLVDMMKTTGIHFFLSKGAGPPK